jgi:uroporphyrinogen-III synthase
MFNLFNILDKTTSAKLLRCPWLLISERMRESAVNLGHNAGIIIARKASDAGIHQAICEWAQQS